MKIHHMIVAGMALTGTIMTYIAAQDGSHVGRTAPVSSVQGGYHFLTTKVYSAQDDQRILNMFNGLRVSDVSDGMDAIGLPNVGLMDPDIAPLWVNPETHSHRMIGIAVTARYVPSQSPEQTRHTEGEFERWAEDWYYDRAPESFIPIIRPGSIVVIDDAQGVDVGTVDSNSLLTWYSRGACGVVTIGGARDTDELTTQKIPVYFTKPARGIRPGRSELESVNRPIVVGGVCVMPGDVIVADGDGVILVPRVYAERVSRYAQRIRLKDREERLQLYDQLARPQDVSVR